MDIKKRIVEIAFEMGFDAVGFSGADELENSNNNFLVWRDKGYAADMNYLLRENPVNAKPKALVTEAKSIISLLVNYYTAASEDPGNDFGRVAAYAVGVDYHKALKKKIREFQSILTKEIGDNFISRGFSDSVPLLEKSFARNSGLGFFGKNTLIINRPLGSYFFIAEIISNLEIAADSETNGTCGKCTRCIDICPTGALDPILEIGKPVLDSRLCISYLTIENKNSILDSLRKKIGYWIFGCDLCQIVCPYNKKIKETSWDEFKPISGVGHWIRLKDVLSIKSEAEFRYKFSGTPLTRPKRRGLLRNACVVAGNRQSEEALPYLIDLSKNEEDPVIREHASWALTEYGMLPVSSF
ncbi:MAG: tRNA epoxyqueuosine(34) reductase QueG [Candidatus Melainabacteria bacterium]|nr:tRNA epoxyqueuosine(34) reductase QueG [Candidatus Melainabacteria bacterium]MBI3308039.1 tRNA epoxyqueuosine(34) reductase QueG [Candidatus Melainabacteria bacterium]